MADEKLLTVREVSQLLNLTEKEVIDLAEQGKVPAYKIGGVYLRFKRQQVEDFRRHQAPAHDAKLAADSFGDRLADFLYYNDFYIVSFVLLAVLLLIIFK